MRLNLKSITGLVLWCAALTVYWYKLELSIVWLAGMLAVVILAGLLPRPSREVSIGLRPQDRVSLSRHKSD
jgi:hypothetical protein